MTMIPPGGKVRRVAVIGWPVEHSLSPLIHNTWIRRYSLPGEYLGLAVAPTDFRQRLETLEADGFIGANLTIPHKEAALDWPASITPEASGVGAINTLWLDNSRGWHGDNTDWSGFLDSLDERFTGWSGPERRALVLGAGGVSRSIVFALLRRKFSRIIIANRNVDRARQLACDFGPSCRAIEWPETASVCANIDLLVNATSGGMSSSGSGLTVDLERLSSDAIIFDSIYTPRPTKLVDWGSSRGNPTIDGLGMLLHQARPGFHRWFGIWPRADKQLFSQVAEKLPTAR